MRAPGFGCTFAWHLGRIDSEDRSPHPYAQIAGRAATALAVSARSGWV